ncbi:MAG: hypothetical protein GX772_01120 [Alcaligenaceae bacterium]|nr:hypothetical protein [Alcaligenaceae bacterium]
MTAITINNHVLLANGEQVQELPKLAKDAIVRVWAVPTDYSASGYFVDVQPIGGVQSLPACEAGAAAFLATLELPADDSAMAESARVERLNQANADADQLLSKLDEAYPEREVYTWDQQLSEAEALQADPAAVTPLLAALAEYRGIEIEILALKVLEKSMLYKIASGQILGARQWVEQELEAAQTHEEVLQVPHVAERFAAVQAEA